MKNWIRLSLGFPLATLATALMASPAWAKPKGCQDLLSAIKIKVTRTKGSSNLNTIFLVAQVSPDQNIEWQKILIEDQTAWITKIKIKPYGRENKKLGHLWSALTPAQKKAYARTDFIVVSIADHPPTLPDEVDLHLSEHIFPLKANIKLSDANTREPIFMVQGNDFPEPETPAAFFAWTEYKRKMFYDTPTFAKTYGNLKHGTMTKRDPLYEKILTSFKANVLADFSVEADSPKVTVGEPEILIDVVFHKSGVALGGFITVLQNGATFENNDAVVAEDQPSHFDSMKAALAAGADVSDIKWAATALFEIRGNKINWVQVPEGGMQWSGY